MRNSHDLRKKYKSLLKEAKTRIFWGDSPSEVSIWLKSQGVESWFVNQEIKRLKKARKSTIRSDGFVNFIKGSLLTIICSGLVLRMFITGHFGSGLAIACGIGFVYGLSMCINGVIDTLGGRKKGEV